MIEWKSGLAALAPEAQAEAIRLRYSELEDRCASLQEQLRKARKATADKVAPNSPEGFRLNEYAVRVDTENRRLKRRIRELERELERKRGTG